MMIQNQIRNFSATFREQVLIKDDKKENQDKSRPYNWNRVCPYCGASDLIPAGSCQICRNCGAGNGCS